MNKYIGTQLLILCEEKGFSQSELVEKSNIGQSTLSRIMSDKQRANSEQIRALAQILGVEEQELTDKQDAPVFHSHNQKGGYANNYFMQKGLEDIIRAKDETIQVLKSQIAYYQKLLLGNGKQE